MTRSPTTDDSAELRAAVIAALRSLCADGLNVNTAGNVSVRCRRGPVAGMLITPTGMAAAALDHDDLVFVRLSDGTPQGRRAPSSEWRFHRDILMHRPEFNAVVHAHSPFATALAVHGQGLPAFHYMVAAGGGRDIRCAPYATFGTQALSDLAVAALQDRRACLLSHHGQIACGIDLDHALALAREIEHLARIYVSARVIGEPPRLSAEDMDTVIERFRHYGLGREGDHHR